jgi:hypothetical protein
VANILADIYFAYSFFITSPPFITNFMCSNVVTSCNGSPSTATMSAATLSFQETVKIEGWFGLEARKGASVSQPA